MQPIYITASSTGSSPWQPTNWQICPQQISFAVISTGGSSWSIDVTYEDPAGVYPSPVSSAPTALTLTTGSANVVATTGSNSSVGPIAGYRFNVNTLSSAGARVTLVALQAGIG